MNLTSLRVLCLAIWLLAASWQPLHAQMELFMRGNELYQEGDASGAAESYEAVLERGFESAELYYNLGNAYFQVGSPHLAVLNFERAARLNPGDPDVVENLRLARERLADRIEPLPRFWLVAFADWWIRLIPRSLLVALSAAAYLTAGATVASLLVGRPRNWLRPIGRLGVVSGGVALLLGGTLLLRETRYGAPEEAIVMVPEVSVVSAPSMEEGLTLFSLHAGTKVRIDQRSREWVEVVLADGKVGWLRFEVLEVI